MKKIYAFLIALMLCFTARAEVDFTYEVGAEIVSSYVWRGQYNGGLSFQPEVLVGFDALDESIQFRAAVSLWLLAQRPPAGSCHVGPTMAQLTPWQLASSE